MTMTFFITPYPGTVRTYDTHFYMIHLLYVAKTKGTTCGCCSSTATATPLDHSYCYSLWDEQRTRA